MDLPKREGGSGSGVVSRCGLCHLEVTWHAWFGYDVCWALALALAARAAEAQLAVAARRNKTVAGNQSMPAEDGAYYPRREVESIGKRARLLQSWSVDTFLILRMEYTGQASVALPRLT